MNDFDLESYVEIIMLKFGTAVETMLKLDLSVSNGVGRVFSLAKKHQW
jgi:hypothetical protein